MRPAGAVRDELLEEQRRGDRSRVDTPDVLQVGGVAAEFVAVLGHQRQLPERLAVGFAGGDHFAHPVRVVAQHRGHAGSQRADRGARQGGGVHDVGGAFFAGAGERVRQHQPALGVGVVHHDRLAVPGDEDVSGAGGFRPDIVLRSGDDSRHRRREAGAGDGGHGAQHRGGAGHVALHRPHARRRFQRDAAGVEGDALAHEGEMATGVAGGALRAVAEDDQARRPRAPLPHRDQARIPLRAQGRFVPHPDFQTGFPRQDAGLLGQRFRRHHFAGFVDEVPGAVHFAGEPARPLHRRRRLLDRALGDDETRGGHRPRRRVRRVLPVAVEAVRPERRAFRRRPDHPRPVPAPEHEHRLGIPERPRVADGAGGQDAHPVVEGVVGRRPRVEGDRRRAVVPAVEGDLLLDLLVPVEAARAVAERPRPLAAGLAAQLEFVVEEEDAQPPAALRERNARFHRQRFGDARVVRLRPRPLRIKARRTRRRLRALPARPLRLRPRSRAAARFTRRHRRTPP